MDKLDKEYIKDLNKTVTQNEELEKLFKVALRQGFVWTSNGWKKVAAIGTPSNVLYL